MAIIDIKNKKIDLNRFSKTYPFERRNHRFINISDSWQECDCPDGEFILDKPCKLYVSLLGDVILPNIEFDIIIKDCGSYIGSWFEES